MNSRGLIIAAIIIILIIIGIAIWGGKGGTNSPTATTTAATIKIGFIAPLTGDLANIGAASKAAVEIAVDEINAAGGVNGSQIAVTYEDDQCAGAPASSAVTKLISVDKVSAIIGSTCSGSTLSAAPIAEAAKIPMIAYCSTAPAVSTAGDFIFRDVPSDLFQASFAAHYLYTNMGKHKAALVYINNEWGVGLRDAFTKSYTDLGGQVVATEAYEPTSKDLRSQMSKVKTSAAEVIYFPGFTDGSIAGIKQAKELGIKLPIFGADAWDDAKIWTELGKTGDGVMYSVINAKNPDAFKAKMEAKVGPNNLPYCAPYAYDALKVVAAAMQAANSTDGTKVKDAMYAINYTGGAGVDPLSFDQNGDPKTANYVIKVAKDGRADVMPATQ